MDTILQGAGTGRRNLAAGSFGQILRYNETIDWGWEGYRAYNVANYGAYLDGVNPDDDALDAAYAACPAGGRIVIPAGTTMLTKERHEFTKALTLDFRGATIFHDPTDAAHYSPFRFAGTASNSSSRTDGRNITGSIAIGDATFTAANAADTADLVSGDWLIVFVSDAALNDWVTVDWVQVSSVNGAIVTPLMPFRTAFDSAHTTVKFRRVTNLIENVTILGGKIYTTQANTLPLMDTRTVKDIKIIGLQSHPRQGNPFYFQYCKGVTMIGCDGLGATTQGSEIASCVDVRLAACSFMPEDYAANAAGLTIDMGTAFFSVVGCGIFAGTRGLPVQYGCHDGSIIGNPIVSNGNASIGIQLLGTQRVTAIGNPMVNLGGGTSYGFSVDRCVAGSTGYSYDGVTPWAAAVPSQDNVMAFNPMTGYTDEYVYDTLSNLFISATGSNLSVESTKGAFLPTRMTSTQRDALTAVNGMFIYNSTTNAFNVYENGAWKAVTTS